MSTTIMTLLAKYDDLFRCQKELSVGNAEEVFFLFLQQYEYVKLECQGLIHQAKDLQMKLDMQTQQTISFEQKLNHARKLLENERKARREAEAERDAIYQKMSQLREVIDQDHTVRDETKKQFAVLNNYTKKRKSIIREEVANEINSTGSFLSDLSLTQSEDDFLESKLSTHQQKWKKHRPSYNNNNQSFLNASGKKARMSTEKRRSARQSLLEFGPNDKIVAHTKVSIPHDKRGPICAESVIESVPMNIPSTPVTTSSSTINDVPMKRKDEIFNENQFKTPMKKSSVDQIHSNKKFYTPSAPSLNEVDNIREPSSHVYATVKKKPTSAMDRAHSLSSKTFLKPENCGSCTRRIRFGTAGLKCSVCRVCFHQDCRENNNVPCVPQSAHTPVFKGGVMGYIGDYTPNVSPMVPALIVFCLNEIESRGLTEIGLYRVSGSEREVKALKESFLKNKNLPSLASIDVHVLCGCVKDFLRSLREPLIPMNLWVTFSNASETAERDEDFRELYKAVNMLPQANRDTLAYLILHFQRIAECPEVKMPLSNFAKVFGPTIVGYSCPDPEQNQMFAETNIQFVVMTVLLKIPTDYWNQFVSVDGLSSKQKNSDENIDGYGSKFYLGTPSLKINRKERKFYATPPYPAKKK